MPVNPQFSMMLPMLPQAIAMSRAIAEGKMEPLDIQPGMMGPMTPVAHVEDHVLETAEAKLPVRIYAPRQDAKLPLVLYFHGGGFISGDVNTHDELTRQLALAADAVVLSVSYRLAPPSTRFRRRCMIAWRRWNGAWRMRRRLVQMPRA